MKFRIPQPHALRHPLTGEHVVPAPGVAYADDDPLVLAYPWSFLGADELEGAVETGTNAPGEKRSLRRPAKKAAKAKPEPEPKAKPEPKEPVAPETPAGDAGDGDELPAPEGE